MKKKSEFFPEVQLERWKTPIMYNSSHHLYVNCILQAGDQVHFFIYNRKQSDRRIHVLSIPRSYPYRVMENAYAYAGVGQYFRVKNPDKIKKPKGYKGCCTWKLWNTNFIKELNGGIEGKGALSGYGQIKPEKIIHYVIRMADEVIEFISPTMRWELHKNIKMKNLVELYVKKRFYERFYKYDVKGVEAP